MASIVKNQISAVLWMLIPACFLASAAAAAQEAPRFGSGDVLQTIDVFADRRATLGAEPSTDGHGFRIDFAFRGEPAARQPGFLYLHDGDEAGADTPHITPPASGFTPRLSALGGMDRSYDAAGRSRAAGSFTPRYAGGEIRLSFTPADADTDKAGANTVNITISSEFMTEETQKFGSLGAFDSLTPFERRTGNVGVTLDYLGFRFGAAMSREVTGFDSGVRGFDVGLGYQLSPALSAEISVGEYSRFGERGFGFADRDFNRLELGAAYEMSSRLRFSGGIRFYDYSNRFDSDAAASAGLLYLGTRFNF